MKRNYKDKKLTLAKKQFINDLLLDVDFIEYRKKSLIHGFGVVNVAYNLYDTGVSSQTLLSKNWAIN